MRLPQILQREGRGKRSGIPDFQAIGKQHGLHAAVAGIVPVRSTCIISCLIALYLSRFCSNASISASMSEQDVGDGGSLGERRNIRDDLNYVRLAYASKPISNI